MGAALVLFLLLFNRAARTAPASDLTALKLYSATLPSGVGKVLVYKYCFGFDSCTLPVLSRWSGTKAADSATVVIGSILLGARREPHEKSVGSSD